MTQQVSSCWIYANKRMFSSLRGCRVFTESAASEKRRGHDVFVFAPSRVIFYFCKIMFKYSKKQIKMLLLSNGENEQASV